METVEESIQTNLDRLDRLILQTTIKAHRQCTTVTQAKDKYTQYLMRERGRQKKHYLYYLRVAAQLLM